MPGLPLVVHETTNLGCNCSCSRNAEQMCRQNSRIHLSAEEAIAAEESLSVYCKPVELYNILQRRALQNPSFLQRCLDYKIQARRSKRIQVAVSLYSSQDDVAKLQTVVPLKVLLARPVTNNAVGEQFAIYRVIRASELTSFSAFGSRDRSKVIFLIPQMGSHEDSKSNNLTILFIGHVKSEGFCLLGKLSVGTLYLSCDKFSSLYMGHRVDMLSIVEMHPIFLEHGAVAEDDCITFRIPHVSANISSSTQVQVNISAQEVGGKEPSPYHSFAYDDVPSSSLSHILRLRAGNVIFNYRYYNNSLQKTEVTEDFSCSFCLVKCASFKGLRYHLTSSHDLFNFEFWVTEEYQAVNVSVKADVLKSEIVADGVDPRHQTFFLCSRPRMRQKTRNGYQHSDNVHPQKLDSLEAVDASPRGYLAKIASKDSFVTSPMDVEPSNGFSSQKFDDGQLHTYSGESSKEDDRPFKELDSENYPSQNAHKSESNGYGADVTPHTLLQFAKTRKLSLERTDPRNRLLLQKRQFFHSHRAQPMAIEQVLSDRDSEDEVDDDIADFEDRRMLDDFVDVTRDEKQIMHLWNSFVRKQRVLADGHIPWACEAFSRLHGQEFVGSPALIWCWRLLMIKLWNHGLLDGRTMNQCNLILEGYTKDSDANKS